MLEEYASSCGRIYCSTCYCFCECSGGASSQPQTSYLTLSLVGSPTCPYICIPTSLWGKVAFTPVGGGLLFRFLRRSGGHAQHCISRWPFRASTTSFLWIGTFDVRQSDRQKDSTGNGEGNKGVRRKERLAVTCFENRKLVPTLCHYRRYSDCSVFRRTRMLNSILRW